MTKAPRISDAEWIVMEVLWSRPESLTAAEIVEALATLTTWNPRTIKTLLNRLVRKGALAHRAEGNRYFYRPAVKRDVCVRSESASFASRIFRGATGPMLVHLIAQAKLSDDDIRELRNVLEKKGKRP